jgi:hypothetical protein
MLKLLFPRQVTYLRHKTSALLQVQSESSQAPMPIDVMMNANYIARKAHESIKGIKVGSMFTLLHRIVDPSGKSVCVCLSVCITSLFNQTFCHAWFRQ